MSLLHLSADELREALEHELASNPALEQVEAPTCPACGRQLAKAGPCPICTAKSGEVIVFTSPAQDFGTGGSRPEQDSSTDSDDSPESLNLAAHLLRQIGPELAVEDRSIAAHLLTSLDDDGLLASDPAEVAAYFHVPMMRVENIRSTIQRADPLGCASTSPQEALSIQLGILKETRSIPPGAEACLAHFERLARHQYASLALELGTEEDEVESAARFIGANLNPYPARAFWGGSNAPSPAYRTPDIVIRLGGDAAASALIVEIAQPFAGSLRVNPLFKRALHEANEDKIEAWQADLDRASLLVKCAGQRAGALERIMAQLAVLQRGFIQHGEMHLLPLTRVSLARALGVHESTISRAVAGKSVQLPNGRILPLAKFFERHLPIRTALRQLVDEESAPLSDDDLAARLRQMGFPVARRTVTKYRNMERILPAYLRKT
jgi:RNA polymerase sigma-54 factor